MSVNVCLPLFGTPAHELEAEKSVSGAHLRKLGDDLRDRLLKAADLLEKLRADGWVSQMAMYEVILTRPAVETREQAEEALRAVGIDPAELMIIEEVEDEGE
jgi:hypothetical protein